jgi:hypothetical protein
MEAINSSETSAHTRFTRRHISEDGILHSHRCKNLKSYKKNIALLFEIPSSRCEAYIFLDKKQCRVQDGAKHFRETATAFFRLPVYRTTRCHISGKRNLNAIIILFFTDMAALCLHRSNNKASSVSFPLQTLFPIPQISRHFWICFGRQNFF